MGLDRCRKDVRAAEGCAGEEGGEGSGIGDGTVSPHTPGPWHAREWNCHAPTTVGVGADLRQFQPVAECSGLGSNFSNNEEEANARLIAAAPELLAALREFLAWGGQYNADHEAHIARYVTAVAGANAAIARVEGQK